MSEHTDFPPVLEALRDDLYEAMKAAGAASPASRRIRVVAALAGTQRRASVRLAIACGAAAVVVLAVLVFGTTGRGPSNAFAGWAAAPGLPASGQLRAAEAACKQSDAELGPLLPRVSDTRGPDSLLVYATSGLTTTCVTGRIPLGTVILNRADNRVPVNSGQIEPTSIGHEFAADGQAFVEMTGQVGSGVSGVTIVLSAGNDIRATVAGGRFAAWWPVSKSFESGRALERSLWKSLPRSFQVTTAAGTQAQPLTRNAIQQATAQPLSVSGGAAQVAATGSTGVSGATGATGTVSPGSRPSTVDGALAASFAVLRTPGPSPVALPEDIAGAYTGPVQPANPYGIDPNLARYVAAANTWILPGSSGVCVITIGIVGPGVGSGTCDSTLTALAGDFIVYSHKWPTDQLVLVGLAPDGNPTVAVTDADGTTNQIPVTNNVYVVTGGNPSSMRLNDASGAPTTVPIP